MTQKPDKRSCLTLGPLSYHWSADNRRDFYYRIADEAPVDEVYLGEVVCSKRAPLFDELFGKVVERLQKAGKKVRLSTLAMIATPQERAALEKSARSGFMVEANDVGAIQLLNGRDFIVGPYITVLNEGSLGFLVERGAKRIVFASEMTGTSMGFLARSFPAIEKEAQIFGRQPLAIAMRCYHARAAGRDKDHCRFACGQDEDGLNVKTLDGDDLWNVSGTQTLSSGTLVLARETAELRSAGITHFRLSPQNLDMVRVSALFRDLLDDVLAPEALIGSLKTMAPELSFINGFYHGREGRAFVA